MAEKVKVLRQFRNEYLPTNTIGKILVTTSYNISPPAADFIRENAILKKKDLRVTLKPVVFMIKKTTE